MENQQSEQSMNIKLPVDSPLNQPDFTFGVATSSFQIEGAADTRLPCIWDTFCGQPGAIVDGSDGLHACEHIDKYLQDVDTIASLGVDAYRFSIAWGRVQNLDGSINQQGMAFYIKLLDALCERNIKAYVTLYHWDLPQHLEDKGGWLNRQTAYRFRDYVAQVVTAFGDRVSSYATLNEPWCSAYLGYDQGVHAPGLKGVANGRQAAHHLLLAHGLAMEVLRTQSPDTLNGIVLNFSPSYPATDAPADIQAAARADDEFNHWYIRPLMEGRYPDLFDALPQPMRPTIEPGDMDIISQPLDFLGINYYSRTVYRAGTDRGFEPVPPEGGPVTDMGWEIYPKGFTDILIQMHQRYSLPPVYITENGAAFADRLTATGIPDTDRVEYFQQHLLALDEAMRQGVDVRGYFAWSLMDNFEWAEGYQKRFGLIYVDYQNQRRVLKQSAHAYRQLLIQRRG